MKIKKIYIYFLSIFVLTFNLVSAHTFLYEMNKPELIKFQQKLIKEKFLDPTKVTLGEPNYELDKAYDKSLFCKNNPQMFENDCEELKYDYVKPFSETETLVVPEEESIFSKYLVEIILALVFLFGSGLIYLLGEKKENNKPVGG